MNFKLLFLIIFLVLSGLFLFNQTKAYTGILNPVTTSTPTPKPSPIILKQALPNEAYTIIMVGDSMTESACSAIACSGALSLSTWTVLAA